METENKITNSEALAKIKVWIKKYYEDSGRGMVEIDDGTSKTLLIEEIEDIISNTEISPKNLIMEDLELEAREKEEGGNLWGV